MSHKKWSWANGCVSHMDINTLEICWPFSIFWSSFQGPKKVHRNRVTHSSCIPEHGPLSCTAVNSIGGTTCFVCSRCQVPHPSLSLVSETWNLVVFETWKHGFLGDARGHPWGSTLGLGSLAWRGCYHLESISTCPAFSRPVQCCVVYIVSWRSTCLVSPAPPARPCPQAPGQVQWYFVGASCLGTQHLLFNF